ncbi:MAG: hypothetical protein ACTS5I_15300, partial [Rhodanobacter sp.]
SQLAIEVTDLTVAYAEKPVLWDVDLTVPQGVLLAIVGPNGKIAANWHIEDNLTLMKQLGAL